MTHNLVAYRCIQSFLRRAKSTGQTFQNGVLHLGASLHHCPDFSQQGSLPLEWYNDMFPRLTKLTNSLKNMELIDGRLLDVNNNLVITDERLLRRMHHFKALARAFLGHPFIQQNLVKNTNTAMAGRKCDPSRCFANPYERDPMTVNTLTKVSNFLNISAQQRKTVRVTICPQVTQHRIWTGALEEILKGLKTDIELLDCQNPSRETLMGRQIVSTCLNFLAETANRQGEDASSWMRLKPSKQANSPSTRKWEEVLDMFSDLINCIRDQERLSVHVAKLEVMREGLNQIKDVLIDRNIGYKEVQHHESLVQKKLFKTLGHSSPCLFTLLRYYLHGTTRDMDVDVSGGSFEMGDKDTLCLYMGKIITSDDRRMIWNGIKQLDMALNLFKFVWETAEVKGRIELLGHLWCVGAESRTITYRGNVFIIHGIRL